LAGMITETGILGWVFILRLSGKTTSHGKWGYPLVLDCPG
jgi:hypothetical protein